MQDNWKLIEIFRRRGGFSRLFDLYRKKFESYGAFGTVKMLHTKEEEKTLRGFLGVRYKGTRFPAADFEKAAIEAGYSISLLELLELYYGRQLFTKREQKELKLSAWENLFVRVVLTVGDRTYHFPGQFEINNRENVYDCYRVNKLGPLFHYIRSLYIASMMRRNGDELSGPDRIRQYRSAGCSFEFEADSSLNVYLPDKYTYPKVPIEKSIDIADIDYSELVAITGLTNYNLLNNKWFDSFVLEQSIADKYNFDIEIIMKAFDNPLIHADTVNIFNKIMMCSTPLNLGDKDLVAFVENNRIMRIVQLDQAIGRDFAVASDFIAVIPHKNRDGKHAKINIAKVSKFVDGLLATGDTVQRLYKPVKLPIVKMIDQFDFKLKRILTVHQDEIETLRQYLKKIDVSNKMFFAKDLNNRLYGYSTSCSVCNYQSNILNAFQVKSKMYQKYNLTFYLCAYFEAEGWSISKVRFRDAQKEYTISMEDWITSIAELNRIKAHMLKCEIEIIKKSTYKAFSFDNYEDDSQKAEFELHRIVLTPLMAVKWFEDNRRIVGG